MRQFVILTVLVLFLYYTKPSIINTQNKYKVLKETAPYSTATRTYQNSDANDDLSRIISLEAI